MRWTSVMCLCVVVVNLAASYPVDDSQVSSSKQETLTSLEDSIGRPTSEHSDRDKRTVGVLRRIFPELSKIIDDKIQQLTSVIFRVVGRFVLGGGALGGGGGGGNSGGDGGSRRISITLPTYPPDEDEDETEQPASNSETTSNTPDTTDSNDIPQGTDGESSRRKREVADPQTEPSEQKEVRVPFLPEANNDLQAAATGDDADEAESSNEEVSEDAEEAESGESTRSKRLGVLGNLFGGSGGSGASGGSGGSGNFLFDIIRRTADGAARAAGTVYRMVAGTDVDDLLAYTQEDAPHLEPQMAAATSPAVSTPTRPPAPPAPPAPPSKPTLVAGSGATEQQDENANAPVATGDAAAGAGASPAPAEDGYQAGIPGPITRLFVIANRGIANLIQDLILRLAQTSERIVNFKARLITAII